jgi:hypothetical protein
MSLAIKMVTVMVIFLPYKLSEMGRNASFGLDLIVATVAFGIAYGIIALTGADEKSDGEKPADSSRRGSTEQW